MTFLLAGCGDLGTEAGLRFAALGHRVVGWRRSPGNLPAAIEGVAADLSAAGLPPVPADTSAVVVAIAADASTEEAYRAAYVQGLSNVLNALERDGVAPRRVLFVSSTAVYGDAGGGWVGEKRVDRLPQVHGRRVARLVAFVDERRIGGDLRSGVEIESVGIGRVELVGIGRAATLAAFAGLGR